MLWIEPCFVMCLAALGGLVGGCLMSIAHRQSNKFNIERLEEYWNNDLKSLKDSLEHEQIATRIKCLDSCKSLIDAKLSPKSGGKCVDESKKGSKKNG